MGGWRIVAALAAILVSCAGADGQAGDDPFDRLARFSPAELAEWHGREGDLAAISRSDVNATIGEISIKAGEVRGGSVRFTDQALGNFRGINTMSFATGHGNNAIANTTITIVLQP